MKAHKEADLRRAIIAAFGDRPNALRRVAKVLKKMIPEMEEEYDERDAEYEMGRAPMPDGYMKRRSK